MTRESLFGSRISNRLFLGSSWISRIMKAVIVFAVLSVCLAAVCADPHGKLVIHHKPGHHGYGHHGYSHHGYGHGVSTRYDVRHHVYPVHHGYIGPHGHHGHGHLGYAGLGHLGYADHGYGHGLGHGLGHHHGYGYLHH